MLILPGSALPPGRFPHAATSRLIRPADAAIGETAPYANMYVSDRGGAIRRLMGGAHRHPIAVRRDPQIGYGQPTDGIAEGPAMMRVATDPDVPYYQFQPFRLEAPVNGRLQSWIADLLYVTRCGQVWVREIKRTAADLADPEYEAKLQVMKWLLAGLGWFVRPWPLAEIQGTPEREVNVGLIYFDRAAHVDDLMPRFEEVAARTDTIAFGNLVRELDPVNENRARAAVHRLIMRGRVWADLDRLVEDWTEVRLRPEALRTWDIPFA